ncbi:head-tail adaptor protein [Luteithermobacter gelatinilyticus]|uniref:head-tail adaptor protein n=1 Tax=Luteithermobacter gelatinilyticus TaxID=2582913 RepID=UPI0011074AF7|nr:head-tail adaptor protein [Luteithermobacter gelatinilyticus]
MRRALSRGRLRHSVVCQKAVRTDDGVGGFLVQWQDIATVRAEIIPRQPDRRTDAHQDQARPAFRVRLRHQAVLMETTRLLWQGTPLRVLSVATDQHQRWLNFDLEEDR